MPLPLSSPKIESHIHEQDPHHAQSPYRAASYLLSSASQHIKGLTQLCLTPPLWRDRDFLTQWWGRSPAALIVGHFSLLMSVNFSNNALQTFLFNWHASALPSILLERHFGDPLGLSFWKRQESIDASPHSSVQLFITFSSQPGSRKCCALTLSLFKT